MLFSLTYYTPYQSFSNLSVGVPAGTPTPGVQTIGRSKRSPGRNRRRFDTEGS